jgi:hypothetical protein
VGTAEDWGRSRDDDGSDAECDLCAGTGVMTWQQPEPTATGYVLHEAEHPCPRGCSGWWRMPEAERRRTITEQPRGWAAEANEIGWLHGRELEG